MDPGLKWPNDLVVDDLKLAGVLAEVVSGTPKGMAVVVGLGLNVGWPERDSGPANRPQVAPGEPPAATSLGRLSEMQVGPDELLTSILDHLERRLTELLDPASRTLNPGRGVRRPTSTGDVA